MKIGIGDKFIFLPDCDSEYEEQICEITQCFDKYKNISECTYWVKFNDGHLQYVYESELVKE